MRDRTTIPPARGAAGTARLGATLVVGLVIGLAIAYVAFGREDSAELLPISREDATVPTLAEPAPAPVPPGGMAAADPRVAVAAFLQAESDGDFLASFGLLGTDDRTTYGSAAAWQAGHEAIPPIVGFELQPGGDGRATVEVLLRLRAGLDGVLGLVTAEATSTWTAVAEDGGWRVAFGATTVEPRFLDEAGAATAAAEWVSARQACDTGVTEHTTLVGTTGLADRLCGAASIQVASTATNLPAVDSPRLISAYGPEAAIWARVVEVGGPVPLRAVLAPVVDRWIVVGVLPSSTP